MRLRLTQNWKKERQSNQIDNTRRQAKKYLGLPVSDLVAKESLGFEENLSLHTRILLFYTSEELMYYSRFLLVVVGSCRSL
ncbi:hypothetical protein AC249_AIPGENE19066 [Exaiptasia diaphana]|nr:hypothetical protein AC249_AIPGENE19066 [Exaiptasia diaphana]